MCFRKEEGLYDKVIAVEMIEAVGHEFLPAFFQVLRDRVKKGGIVALQVSCVADA